MCAIARADVFWVRLVDKWCCPSLWRTPTYAVKAKHRCSQDERAACVSNNGLGLLFTITFTFNNMNLHPT